MPAGLYHTVLASSAIAAPPAKAVPMPDAFCSANAKKAAEAGAEMPATAAARADLCSRRHVRGFILFSSFFWHRGPYTTRRPALTIAQGFTPANGVSYPAGARWPPAGGCSHLRPG